jgi:sRNA-binding carbon storage regulator CsrA
VKEDQGCLGLTLGTGDKVIIRHQGLEIVVTMGRPSGTRRRRVSFKAPKEVKILRECVAKADAEKAEA